MKLKDLYRLLIKEKKVSELEIRELISFYQGYPDLKSFFLKLDDEVKDEKKIRAGYKKLLAGYPIAYITNRTTFLGETYYVDKNVLIPRPETEELVVNAYQRMRDLFKSQKKIKVLDVGTGSGVIAIDIAKRLNIEVDATDISSNALKIAKKNAKLHNVKVNFFLIDTYPNNKNKYDVIIANPPYIKYKKDVDKSVLDYEPHDALFISEKNNVYKKILKQAESRLNVPGLMIFEIADNIEKMIKDLVVKYIKKNDACYVAFNDINKKRRFIAITVGKNHENLN